MNTIYKPNLITVPFSEYSPPTASFNRPGTGKDSATRVLRCLYSDHVKFVRELLGSMELNSQGGLAVTLAAKHPIYNSMYAKTASVATFHNRRTTTGELYQTNEVLVTVNYEPDSAQPFGGGTEEGSPPFNWVEETLTPTRELLTLPVTGLYWDDAQTEPIDDIEAPAGVVEMATWQIRFPFIPSVPAWASNLVGRCNSGPVFSARLNRSFEAESLLFGSPVITNAIDTLGQVARSLTLNITYRRAGWNKFYRGGSVDPQFIYLDDGTVYRPYPPDDFTQIVISL